MPSEHLNLKLKDSYMQKLKEIAATLGISDLSKVLGSIPMVIRFSITFTHSELQKLYKVIPTLHPADLQTLLLSIKNQKTLEYHRTKDKNKAKLPKE